MSSSSSSSARHQLSPASPGTSPCPRTRPLAGHPRLAAPADTPGEEILAALALAERVKGAAKAVSPTLWDPEREVAARREEIRGLRTELLAATGGPEQERAVAQLQRALRELQVGERPWVPYGLARIALILWCPRASSSTGGNLMGGKVVWVGCIRVWKSPAPPAPFSRY